MAAPAAISGTDPPIPPAKIPTEVVDHFTSWSTNSSLPMWPFTYVLIQSSAHAHSINCAFESLPACVITVPLILFLTATLTAFLAT